MRKGVCLMLVALIVAVAAAQDFGEGVRQPRAGDYVGEAGGALLGGALVGAGATVALGFVGAGVASGTSQDEWAGLGGFIIGGAAGVALGYPLGCGLGTTLAGGALDAEGNTGAAYGGAYAGIALGVLAGLVSRSWEVCLLTAGVLPPAGAVIGYNIGATRNGHLSSFGDHLAPPAVAFGIRSYRARQRQASFVCRLLTLRL